MSLHHGSSLLALHKKGIIRIGVCSLLVFVSLTILIAPLFFTSTTATELKVYVLGESVKINLDYNQTTDIKIITPSTTLRFKETANEFIFKPQEEGSYTLTISSAQQSKKYLFVVIPTNNSVSQQESIKEPMHEVIHSNPPQNSKASSTVQTLPAKKNLKQHQEISFEYEKANSASNKLIQRAQAFIDQHLNDNIEVEVYTADGERSEVHPAFDITEGKINVDLDSNLMRPGIYKLKVIQGSGANKHEEEQEFAYGLVSFNTYQDSYLPNQTASFVIVVLDAQGRGVCNASIQASITRPNNIRENVVDAITPGAECGLYEGEYQTSLEGVYGVDIATQLQEMQITFNTSFHVQASPIYQIKRTTAAKIDPTQQDIFEVTIEVSAQSSVQKLQIIEVVPRVFEVQSAKGEIIKQKDSQQIRWTVSGNSASLTYSYKVPPVWPMLYTLGPLQVNDYSEARPWYVAVDPIIVVDNASYYDTKLIALTNRTFVVAWVDAVENDVSFKIYDTNGTNLTGDVDVDTTVNGQGRVSLAPINASTFMVGWYDGIDEDVRYAWYNAAGTAVVGATDVETTVGNTGVDLSLANMGSSFQYCYIDSAEADADLRTITYATLGAGSEIEIDTNAGPDAALHNLVECAAINSSRFVYTYFDDQANDISFYIGNESGSQIVGVTDADTGVGNNAQVAASALDNDKFLLAWVDSGTGGGDQNAVEFQVRYSNATAIFNGTLDANAGSGSYRIATTALKSSAESKDWFIIAWNDRNSSDIRARVYNSTGTIKYGTYTLTSTENDTSLLFDIYAKDPLTNISICDDKFLFAYTNSSGKSIVQTFNVDGTLWSGICGESDTTPPTVTLVSPPTATNITNSFDLEFIYQVTDTSTIQNCSLFMNDQIVQSDASVSKDTNQSFIQYLSNGYYNWSVGCFDIANNTARSENRTLLVNLSQAAFSARFYETGILSYTDSQTALLRLNNTRDATQNTAAFDIPSGTLATIVQAVTPFMHHNGAVIPKGSTITFSASFSATNTNVESTWKLYIANATTTALLCQNGDDAGSGTPVSAGTISSSNTSCISTDLYLKKSDRLIMVMNGYAIPGATRSVTHAWDGSTSSYLDINLTTEGFLNASLIAPATDPAILTGQTFNMSCQVSCPIGTCRNTAVYAQYNTSSTDWANISSSGNLILAAGETNPHSLGNLTTSATTNFTINGSTASVNNIRCFVLSSYDAINSNTTQQVTVSTAQVAPSVTLLSPANDFGFNTSSITLYYNATDTNNNFANATLIINGQLNMTNQSGILNGQSNNFTTTLPDGVYNWTVNVTDATNLVGTTTQRNFTIDTNLPLISLLAPPDGTAFTVDRVEFNFTAVDNLDTSLLCNLTIDSVVVDQNFQAINGSVTNRTIVNLAIGTHFWNATCIDNVGNKNTSILLNFTVQDLSPSLVLITPNNSFTNTGNITLAYNATDNNGFKYSFLILNNQINQTNQTAILNGQSNNFTLINLEEGIYNWTVNVTDTAGFNSTNISRVFTVDKTSPSLVLNAPANDTTSPSATVEFNFTAADNLDTSLLCNLTVGDTHDLNIASANGTLTSRTISALTDGPKLWNVTCIDDASNLNISQTRLITIAQYPTIALNTSNNSFFNASTINLSYTPSDNTNLSSCSLFIDGSFNQLNQSAVRNNQQNNFSVTVSSGLHTWYVACNDTIALMNQSQVRTFTVDLNGLSVTSLAPADGINIFANTVTFNFTAVDDLDPILNCNITVNSNVVNSSLAPNGSIISTLVPFSTGGFKLWNVTCMDDAGNRQTSATRNFTLSFAPLVTLISPANNTFHNSSQIVLTYNASDDNDNIANATLILNGQLNMTNQSGILNGQSNNFTTTLPDGVYNWTVNVTDTTNLVGTDNISRVFTIDTHAPLINLQHPVFETISVNNITLNFTVTDNIDTLLLCNVTVSDTLEFLNLDAANASFITRFLIKGDGNYSWYAECRDDASNYNISSTANFTVEAPPNVTLLNPSNERIINTTQYTFIYVPTDPIGIANCSFYVDDVINLSSDTITANQNNSFTANLTQGRHTWTVECVDAFPDFNIFKAPVYNVTIDTTPPLITLNAPLNSTNTLKTLTFNFTVTDTLSQNISCDLFVDSVRNASVNVTNGSITALTKGNYSLGMHLWNVSCVDSAKNLNWSATWLFNVTKADFSLNSTDLIFNNSNPVENETVRINATIHNLANVTATNVVVRFYEGNETGSQIGADQTISILQGLSQQTVNVDWHATLGPSVITVVVDPPLSSNGTFDEWDETNNKANYSLAVGGWHFVYGLVDSLSEFELAAQANKSILRWTAANTKNGTIFVADSESIIGWNSLTALGINKTGSNATNDFAQADSLLNMSLFADSIVNLFTNNSEPKNTSTLVIFGREIQGIPLTSSINNTNFLTGILWDASDDTNGEYDAEKEDLLFITKITKQQPGAYGTYDYELRIPANLRAYIPAESRKVVFYAELV